MSELSEDDPDFRRQPFGDVRDDYDDEFGRIRSPYEIARRRVLIPAMGIVVTGSLGVAGSMVGAAALVVDDFDRALNSPAILARMLVGLFFILLGTALSVIVTIGGASMMRLQRRRLALLAAYVVTGLAVVGCYAIFFFPFGIWALVLLYQTEVRREFGRPPPPRNENHD